MNKKGQQLEATEKIAELTCVYLPVTPARSISYNEDNMTTQWLVEGARWAVCREQYLSAIPWDKLSDILVGIRSISLTQDREYQNETRDSNDRSKS